MGIFDKFFGEKHSIDRFVGGDKAAQKRLKQKAEEVFREQKTIGPGIERPKTPEELEMIKIVNAETDLLREKYGLPEYRVPPKNYHVIRREKKAVAKMESDARHILPFQSIDVVEDGNRSLMLKRFFHETVHFKSYAAVNVEPVRERRLGLVVHDNEKELHFMPLNEAVTEELTKRFMRAQEDLPMLTQEMESLREMRRRYGAAEMDDIAALRVQEIPNEPDKVDVTHISFSYVQERQALHLLIEKLQQRNSDPVRTGEEWFDMLASAMFNGHLLELARNIEKAFGQGAFRKLGEQKNGEQLLSFVKSL